MTLSLLPQIMHYETIFMNKGMRMCELMYAYKDA